MARAFRNSFVAPFLTLAALLLYQLAFYATKPSPLESANLTDLLLVALNGLALCALVAGLIALLSSIASLAFSSAESRGARVGRIAAFVIATMGFLTIIENFVYTLLGSGLKNTDYAALKLAFLVAALFAAFHWSRAAADAGLSLRTRVPRFVEAALVIALVVAAPSVVKSGGAAFEKIRARDGLTNLVILSSDGINAENMSVYGYERETTPFLDSKAEEFAIFENSFANSYGTYGSMTSLWTGMSPITTGVVNRPHILSGPQSTQSFPRILGDHGFKRTNWGVVVWASARSTNLLDAFDEELGSRLAAQGAAGSSQPGLLSWLVSQASTDTIGALAEVIFVGQMDDPMAEVQTDFAPDLVLDTQRLEGVIADVEGLPEPFYVNSHFMQSHGPLFTIAEPHFSRGQTQKPLTKDTALWWETDFYDDAILNFDDRIRMVYEALEASGRLERTILIVTSDHGKVATIQPRIPLLIRFPEARGAGRFRPNVSRLDIAPTILAANGLEVPAWMEGMSLIDHDAIPKDRMLFGTRLTRMPLVSVPFDQFLDENHGVVVIFCDKAFRFDDRLLAAALREPFASLGEIEAQGRIPVVALEESSAYECTADRESDLKRVVRALRDRFIRAGRVGIADV